MRIAWLLYGAIDQRTGGTIYDAEIIRGLRRRGDTVEILSLERGRPPSPLVRHLVHLRSDVVVGDELCFRELAFVFPRTTFARRVLLVHHLTCWEVEHPPALRLRARHAEAIALRHSDAIITTSEATRRRLVTEGHRGPLDVVLPGADRLAHAARGTRVVDREPLRFLFVGAIIPRKRVRELVRSFASVTTASTLRLVGRRDADPHYTAEVERTIDDAGCRDRVTFLGEITDPDLSQELASADVLVMPSSLEGYGIAATEAVRAGTPVIAARTPGLEEALAPAPTAALFIDAPADDTAVARALRDFATTPTLRASMREAAARAKLPTWSAAADRFGAILDAL